MVPNPSRLRVPLQKEAECWASAQGIWLNQLILWSVAEKDGAS